jgi:hypothetical protein
MRRAIATFSITTLAGAGLGCKKTPDATPSGVTNGAPGVAVASGAGAPAASTAASAPAPRPDAAPARRPAARRSLFIDTLAVSSRVDNGTETPEALFDNDFDTAWSSRTNDLEGAWVALRLRADARLGAALLTVGMTKTEALFAQNPRIAEVSVSWLPIVAEKPLTFGPERVLAEGVALDPESRELQRVPAQVAGEGVLKITVKKVKLGSKPSWREVSISELALEGEGEGGGRLDPGARAIAVGGLEPRPRGVLGIIPEEPPPFRCLALSPDAPRAYCVLGYWQRSGAYTMNRAELVTVGKDGVNTVAPLAKDPSGADARLPYASWLRAERELKARGRTLGPAGARAAGPGAPKQVPWEGSLEVDGVTFRQRTTAKEEIEVSVGSWTEYNGVLEVRWPEAAAFETVFDDFPIRSTQPMAVTLRPLGAGAWLVERTMSHGSEGRYASGAEASFCDFAAKRCTNDSPPSDDGAGER